MDEYNKLYATLNQLDEVKLLSGVGTKQDEEESSNYKLLIQVCMRRINLELYVSQRHWLYVYMLGPFIINHLLLPPNWFRVSIRHPFITIFGIFMVKFPQKTKCAKHHTRSNGF